MIDALCPIFQSGKGFCWAPAAAWGCSDMELCVKCKAKSKTAAQPVFTNPDSEAVNKLCKRCGSETYKGREFCAECLQYPNRPVLVQPKKPENVQLVDRTCRFCGRQNIYRNQWRKKDQMCRKKACLEKFVAELKLAI